MNSSSETPGNWGERRITAEGESAGGKGEETALFSPSPHPCPLRHCFRASKFPAHPMICPWVSEDEMN